MRSVTWQLQDARKNLSRVIKLASGGAAQVVTVHGKPAAVILSTAEYEMLTRRDAGPLSRLLLSPGLAGGDLDLARHKDSGRKTTL